MLEFDVIEHFKAFEKNLRTSEDDVNTISNRVKVITKIINKAYWNIDSEVLHSILVGSYGRGTAIHLSDIDLLVELPENQKDRFAQYSGNGQSALLQDLKSKLLKHYSDSIIKGDGQIVSIEFSDGIRFEVLPAFKLSGTDKYEYPNANNGGSWEETDPRLEQYKLTDQNKRYKSAVKKFCRILRAWNDTNDVGLHGIAIDSLSYSFFKTWDESKTGYVYFDWISRDFFRYVINFIENNNILLSLDGSYSIEIDTAIKRKAESALNNCEAAIVFCRDNQKSEEYWSKVFGKKFPKLLSGKNFQTDRVSISKRSTREPIGTAIDTEQFADEMGWDIAIEKTVEIQSSLEINGFRKGSISHKFRIPIKPNSKIIFSVKDAPGIYWYWKVRNVGAIANSRNAIRGQIVKRTYKIVEPINFKGNHYVEVYGVHQGRVKIYGKIDVPLEDFL